MESLFKKEWAAIEDDATRPRRMRSIVKIPFSEFKHKVLAQDKAFVKEIVHSIYAGDVLVLRGAYTPEFIEHMKTSTFEWGKKSESSFHKMFEGVPDFHRIIDASVTKNYAIEAIRHIYYFFPWNNDPCKLMDAIYEKWRVIKFVGGYDQDQYTKNTPKDGIIDRIVLAQYPPGTGELETHCDPFKYQRTIMGTKMSRRGIDYEVGGLYFVDSQDREIDLEDQIELGDMYLSYATVYHGVKMIDPHKQTDWNKINGRWFMGLYSAVSDESAVRHTCWSAKTDAEGTAG